MVNLHCIALGAQTGISRYAVELARALRLEGEPVRILDVKRREVRLFGKAVGGHLSVQLQNLWKPLRHGDVLHSTHAYAAHPRSNVVTVHDCFPEQHAEAYGTSAVELRWLRHVIDRVERRRPQYITPTEAVKSAFLQLRPGVPPERVHVTYEGVREAFRPLLPGETSHPAFPHTAFNILCVADCHPRKRLDWLYDAARALDVRVIHIGGAGVDRPAWNLQRARERETGERLGPRLVRLGRVGEAELASAYRSADLLVAPSLDEGFGFPPLEALRSGTPVLVLDRPVFREVLGRQASYFADAAALGPALAAAIARGRPTAAQRRANSQFVSRTYPWSRSAQLTLQVYHTVRSTG
jgi:glycosyltransferase involved in cell wall biosynthesis